MQQTVALGFHSLTKWVFLPHVVALYDSVTINRDKFSQVLEKAAKSPSDDDNRKAGILRFLQAEGRLRPVRHEVSVVGRQVKRQGHCHAALELAASAPNLN